MTLILLTYNSGYFSNVLPAAAVVGLERTFYNVPEDVGVVEVCVIVYVPSGSCPIAFPFDVSFSTNDGSAGKPNY